MSPPQSPVVNSLPLDSEVFNPSDARLSDNDSVVISVDTITPYLDAALKALGLHTEARTSFITLVQFSYAHIPDLPMFSGTGFPRY